MDVDALIKIMPPLTESNRPYWDGTLAGELRLQRCDECGTFRYPEAPACPNCLNDSATWTAASGGARLWSWIVMHQNYIGAFADELPYLVAFVRLDEGPFMYSTIVEPPAELRCDLRLRVVFEQLSADRAIPKFRVAE